MVEKTRRSVSVLRRCQESDREELNYWRRRSSQLDGARKSAPTPSAVSFSKSHSPLSTDAVSSGESALWYTIIEKFVPLTPVVKCFGIIFYKCFKCE